MDGDLEEQFMEGGRGWWWWWRRLDREATEFLVGTSL